MSSPLSNLQSPDSIPAEDLTRQYANIADEINAAIHDVLPRGKYTLGPDLAALNIGAGDEVITVCNTYAATAFAISYVGARPVFVDVDEKTFNLNVEQVARKITPRTRAILPVHLYGQPVELEPLLELARQHNLFVVEDDAHAHGATYHGKKVGSFGAMGCFSF